MKRTLSRLAVVSFFILGSICLTPYAGELGNVHIAEITFDFYIANELLSAGEYTFKNSFLHPGVILAQDSKGRAVCALTFRKTTHEADSSRLVFNKYGDKHFLHEIWGASRTGRELRRSRTEKAVVFSESKFERIAINLQSQSDLAVHSVSQ